MEQDNRQDLQINGAGKNGGGCYRNIRINGSSTITGDIDCLDFTANGMVTVNGMLTAQTASINGSSEIQGVVKVDALKVSGSMRIASDATLKTCQIHGSVNVQGGITAETITLHGALQVKEDCNAELFDATGGFTIGGLLNADKINVRLHGECRAREIGGSVIEVKKGFNTLDGIIILLFRTLMKPHRLYAESIEGDDISLEATTAKVVRGKRVTIGVGCEVDLVEYTETYLQMEDVKVKETRQMGKGKE